VSQDAQGPVLGVVLKGYPRLSETFISNEIRLLEKKGYAIHIFSMRKPRETFSHSSVKEIKAQVTYLPSTLYSSLHRFLIPNLRALARHPHGYRSAFRGAFNRYSRSRHTHHFRHLLQAGYLVGKGMAGRNITHLHAHFAHSPTAMTMWASTISGVPFSFSAHAKDIYTSNPKRLRERMEQAKFAITCTNYNRDYLRRLAPRGAPIYPVYHGSDLSLFSDDGRPVQAEPPYTILTVARFVEKKGLPTVFRALSLLREQGVPFQYVLVGTGDEEDSLRALLAELGLDAVTTLTGALPHEDVIRLYRQAELTVLGCQVASNGDRDGIPNVLVESMAMGVPVAATDISGIPELVRNGDTGLLVPSKDPERLAQAMKRLLTDGDLRARVIPAARRWVRQQFDNAAQIEEVVRVFREHGVEPGKGE
jgi:glycosyltransferase involved in cell wall biosynthesis